MAKQTYKQAHGAVLAALAQKGWLVNANLKVPHATHPDGCLRLWFKAQAVYYSVHENVKDMGSARSLWCTGLREGTAEQFCAMIENDRKTLEAITETW